MSSASCPERGLSLTLLLFDELEPDKRQELEAHLGTCQGCLRDHQLSTLLRQALDVDRVPPPEPIRWSLLRERVLTQDALEAQACPEWQDALVSFRATESLCPGLPEHLEACLGCAGVAEQLERLDEALSLDVVPLPESAVFEGMKAEVLAATEARRVLRPLFGRAVLLRGLAALMLIGLTVALALGLRGAPSLERLGQLREQADEALLMGRLTEAQGLLSAVIEGGGARAECHRVVRNAAGELDALRRFTALPSTTSARKLALGRFIYRYPGARITARAMSDYAGLAKPRSVRRGTKLEDFRVEAAPRDGTLVSIQQGQHGKAQLVAFTRRSEPFLRDAARLHLAALLRRGGDSASALAQLRAIQGRSPAARLAQELLESLPGE